MPNGHYMSIWLYWLSILSPLLPSSVIRGSNTLHLWETVDFISLETKYGDLWSLSEGEGKYYLSSAFSSEFTWFEKFVFLIYVNSGL